MTKKILYDSNSESDESTMEEIKTVEKAPKIKNLAPKHKIEEPQIIQQKKDKIDEPKQYFCQHCNTAFTRNTFLNKHINELRCKVLREQTKLEHIKLQEIKKEQDQKEMRRLKRIEKQRIKDDLATIKLKEELKQERLNMNKTKQKPPKQEEYNYNEVEIKQPKPISYNQNKPVVNPSVPQMPQFKINF